MPHQFYPQLESLRGIAAMLVVVLHLILCVMVVVPDHPAQAAIQQLGVFPYILAQFGITVFNGRSAVVLFFVLSGFVMGLGFDTAKALTFRTYGSFLVRRFFRLMPALWAAVLFAMALGYLTRGQTYPWAQILDFFLLRDLSIDPVFWSLVTEIAACLVYPLMLFATRRINAVWQLAILAVIIVLTIKRPVPLSYGMLQGAFPLLAFYLGLIVPSIGRALIRALPWGGSALVPLAFLIFVAPDLLNCYGDFSPESAGLVQRGNAYLRALIPLACFYVIAWLVYSPHQATTRLLLRRPFRFVGRVSYSIYVLHFPIVLALAQYLTPQAVSSPLARLAIGLLVAVPATLVASALSYRYVEAPFIRLGRRVADAAREPRAQGELREVPGRAA